MAVPTKLISTSQSFQDAKGNVVANGTLSLTLSQNAEVTASGGQVTTEPLYFQLDANGKITSTAIWFSDELSPSGTVYKAILYAANGMRTIQDFGYWSIAGASADLSLMVPTTLGASIPGVVLLTPSGDQHITTNNNLTTPVLNSVRVVDGTKFTTIQAAINDLPAGGGEVYIPRGTYTPTAVTTIPSNVWVRGSGWGTIIQPTGNFDAFQNAGGAAGNTNLRVSDLKIDCTNQTSSGRGIYFQKVTSFTLTNLWIINARSIGILMENGCIDFDVSGNRIESTQAGTGIEGGNGPIAAASVITDGRITNNYVKGCSADGIFILGSASASAYGTARITVANNIVDSCNDTAIEIGLGCQDCTVTGNVIRLAATGTTGITGRGTFGCGYQNNVVFGNNSSTQTAYLLWQQAGDNTISQNNHMSNNLAYNCPIGFKSTAPAAAIDSNIWLGNKAFTCATPYSFSGNETNLFRILNDDGVVQMPASAPFLIDATNAQPRVQKNGDVAWWFKNTAQSITAGGLWRLATNGTNLELDMNTAAGGDFSTNFTALQFDSSGNVIFPQNKAVFAGLAGFEVRNGLLGKWFSDGGATLKAQIDGSTGKLTNYGGVNTVAAGVPPIYAQVNTTGLTGNVSAATLYAVPASGAGMYRIEGYAVVTTAGSVTSTLPNIQIIWTDADTSVVSAAVNLTASSTGNTVGTNSENAVAAAGIGDSVFISAKASTNIQYQTANYASNAAGMTYAIHIRLEYLG